MATPTILFQTKQYLITSLLYQTTKTLSSPLHFSALLLPTFPSKRTSFSSITLSNITQQLEQQPLRVPEASAPDSNNSEIHNNDKFIMSLVGQIPRKRSSKKDRHSKIETAQGPRDRRMRLSLDVARKFFNLQDMLGFDKASKTVGWLLIKSKTAIEELKSGFPAFFWVHQIVLLDYRVQWLSAILAILSPSRRIPLPPSCRSPPFSTPPPLPSSSTTAFLPLVQICRSLATAYPPLIPVDPHRPPPPPLPSSSTTAILLASQPQSASSSSLATSSFPQNHPKP